MPSTRYYFPLVVLLLSVCCMGCPPKNAPLRLTLANGTGSTITKVEIKIPATNEKVVLTSDAIIPESFASFDLPYDQFVINGQLRIVLQFTGFGETTFDVSQSSPFSDAATQLNYVMVPSGGEYPIVHFCWGQVRQPEFIKLVVPQS